MTIYFDKRAFEKKDEEEQKEIEEQLRKVAAQKVITEVVSFFVKPAIIMLLWNWLLPSIFGLATIGYFKALGLYLLSRLFIDKND